MNYFLENVYMLLAPHAVNYTEQFFDIGRALLFLLLLCMSTVSSFVISENIGYLEKECEHRTECKGTRWQQPRAAPFCHWTMVRKKLPLNNMWCFDTVCCNYSNNLECKSTTGKLSSNCHRYLRRQRLFQNTDMKSCSCCSTGKLKGYFKRIMRIQKKLQVKVEKDFPACLPGMCPV